MVRYSADSLQSPKTYSHDSQSGLIPPGALLLLPCFSLQVASLTHLVQMQVCQLVHIKLGPRNCDASRLSGPGHQYAAKVSSCETANRRAVIEGSELDYR